jgi:hypothetical protein
MNCLRLFRFALASVAAILMGIATGQAQAPTPARLRKVESRR